MEFKVTYFQGKGRGEIVRLVLSAAKKPFTDDRLTFDQWTAVKDKAPMKALPILTIKEKGSEKVVCQSLAIVRYLAKEFGFGGANNFEQFQIDEVLGCVDDAFSQGVIAFFEKDPARKEEQMKLVKEKYLPNLISFLKLRLKDQKSGFLVGSKMSLADIAVFNFVDQQKANGETCFDKETEIMKLYEKVKASEGIADWLKKRPKD